MTSYLILSTINPELVNFKIQKIKTINPVATTTSGEIETDEQCINFFGTPIGIPATGSPAVTLCDNSCKTAKPLSAIDPAKSIFYLNKLKYCCICQEITPENYCTTLGTTCKTTDNISGFCDGYGACLHSGLVQEYIGELCGVSSKIGNCLEYSACPIGSEYERIETSGMIKCKTGLTCCKKRY
jgi:hypothetical protein